MNIKVTIKQLLETTEQFVEKMLAITGYPPLEKTAIIKELREEITLLRENLLNSESSEAFKAAFKSQCLVRAKRNQETALSLSALPGGYCNQLYWQIAKLLFEPKHLASMLNVLLPNIQYAQVVKLTVRSKFNFLSLEKKPIQEYKVLLTNNVGDSPTHLKNHILSNNTPLYIDDEDINRLPRLLQQQLLHSLNHYPSLNAKLHEPGKKVILGLEPAARYGYDSVVKILLSTYSDDKTRLEALRRRKSTLATAAYHGHNAVVKTLLDAYPDDSTRMEALRRTDKDGNSTLHIATLRGHATVVETLLSAHPNDYAKLETLRLKNKNCHNALHIAARKVHNTMVRTFMDTFLTDKTKLEALGLTTYCGYNALLLAALEGHDTVVKTLLASFATGKAKLGALMLTDHRGNSALHLAAGNGHDAVVKTLFDNYPDTNAKLEALRLTRDDGISALGLAVTLDYNAVVSILLNAYPDGDAKLELSQAAYNGQVTLVESLLEKLYPSEKTDSAPDTSHSPDLTGYHPLFAAASQSDAHAVVSNEEDHQEKTEPGFGKI